MMIGAFEERRKAAPAPQHVVERLGDCRRAREFYALLAEPDAKVLDERATSLLPYTVALFAI